MKGASAMVFELDFLHGPTVDWYCKGCDPCGQLLCGMLQASSAVHTLNVHFIVAYGRRKGAYNTPVATQWLGQRLYYSLVQLIGFMVV